jgi:hypothetical protein
MIVFCGQNQIIVVTSSLVIAYSKVKSKLVGAFSSLRIYLDELDLITNLEE